MAHFLIYSNRGDTTPAACADADTAARVQTLPGDTIVQIIRGTCYGCNRQIGYAPSGEAPPYRGHVQFADDVKFIEHTPYGARR